MMNRLIRVADIVDGHFLGFRDVLERLSPEAYALQWSILDLGEVMGHHRWDLNLPFIEDSVGRSPTGMRLSFAELLEFSGRVHQVIDGLFVAATRNQWPRRSESDIRILERAEMLVAAFDSSYWLVAAEEPVLARYEHQFTAVETIPAEEVSLSAWPPRKD